MAFENGAEALVMPCWDQYSSISYFQPGVFLDYTPRGPVKADPESDK